MLNISQVYPARRRKSKNTRLSESILNQILTFLFYFNITNSLVYLAISFRRGESILQMASNCPQNQCLNQKNETQKYTGMVLHSNILFIYLDLINQH